ncbi:AMP-binding protein [Roseibium litorale]|uniref:AMP-binding protein n=1 Tax=Roseibium litorale TaxID=2803841 RepID=A0ABR9CL06_9HYPH|nr:AMP-binding protein [Roseibium litorale]MBD8891438.1 AMP-binding protein [Roseibium litorale]
MGYVGESVQPLAEADPERLALSCGPRTLTRRQLSDEILCLARALGSRLPEGGRVALYLEDPIRLLIGFFAAARAGAVAMVYDPAWPDRRRQWIETQTRPSVILDERSFPALMAKGTALREPTDAAGAAPAADAPFYAGFTSGSTGDPKGYCRSHRSWLDSFAVSAAEFAIGEADRVLIPGNMVHSLHLYGAVHGIASGAVVEIAERFNPRWLAARLRAEGPSVLYATPTQIHYMAGELRRSGAAEGVRLVLASGAKWREADRRAMASVFPCARLVEFYGASEMSFITISAPEDNPPDGSVGRAAYGVGISIRSENQEELPAGETGAIWVRSSMLFDGYICGGGSEIARENGWLTVGDRGWLDENGFLYLAGREKRMIITSGLNIYPEEVEQVLLSHEDVALAAVVAKRDPVRGAALVAVVQTETGSGLGGAGLRRHCLTLLGRSRTPRAFLFLDAMPLTPGGKIDLKQLEAMVTEGKTPPAAPEGLKV